VAQFKILVENDNSLVSYIQRTKKKLLSDEIVKNPFTGDLSFFNNIISINLNCVYPDISILGLLITVPIIFFKLPIYLLLITIPFYLSGFLRSNLFLYLAIYRGLRKSGYNGKIIYKRWSYVSN
jgi:hypothetical protein